jgi:putative PIN family toxin of toxin-antitoxin system
MGAIEVTRVVCDTNVLVSGLLFGGIPEKLIGLCKAGRIHPIMSREMVDEFLRVLAYPKFQLSEAEIQYLLYIQVMPYIEMISVHPGPVVIREDPSDDIFLRCAVAGHARYIISGDRHLLNLKTYRRIKILSPADFLSIESRS